MITRRATLAGLVAASVLWTAAAAEQATPVCDPQQSGPVTSGTAEGQVVKVDTANGKVTIREPDGKSREYLASRETLRELKEGDRVHVTFTQPRSC